MPFYEYRCDDCGHQMEAMQKMSDAPLTDCPACGKPALVKLISAAGFQLKGSGWYATDFKGGGKKPAAKDGGGAKTESKADAKSDAKAETKSETKPDTKSDTKSESKPAAKATASADGGS